MTLPTVKLGPTGLEVGRIGFGGIPIQRISRARAVRLLRAALDEGVTLFDTARGYSDSEEKIGLAFKGSCRAGAIIATKSPALDGAGMARDIEASLRKLRTDHIDFYQIHNLLTWDGLLRALRPDGAIAALRRARAAGKIRFIGVTSHSRDFLARVLRKAPEIFDTIQVPFNCIGDESGITLLPLARKAGLGFIAMKPFCGGVVERPDLAFRYVLQFEDVVPIPGMETIRELHFNVKMARLASPLGENDLKTLARIRRQTGKVFCRKCGYCQPCPQAIEIHLALGGASLMRRFNREALAGWCRDVMRKAAGCIKCGLCEKRCPYKLPIRRLLVENVSLFRRELRKLRIPW